MFDEDVAMAGAGAPIDLTLDDDTVPPPSVPVMLTLLDDRVTGAVSEARKKEYFRRYLEKDVEDFDAKFSELKVSAPPSRFDRYGITCLAAPSEGWPGYNCYINNL